MRKQGRFRERRDVFQPIGSSKFIFASPTHHSESRRIPRKGPEQEDDNKSTSGHSETMTEISMISDITADTIDTIDTSLSAERSEVTEKESVEEEILTERSEATDKESEEGEISRFEAAEKESVGGETLRSESIGKEIVESCVPEEEKDDTLRKVGVIVAESKENKTPCKKRKRKKKKVKRMKKIKPSADFSSLSFSIESEDEEDDEYDPPADFENDADSVASANDALSICSSGSNAFPDCHPDQKSPTLSRSDWLRKRKRQRLESPHPRVDDGSESDGNITGCSDTGSRSTGIRNTKIRSANRRPPKRQFKVKKMSEITQQMFASGAAGFASRPMKKGFLGEGGRVSGRRIGDGKSEARIGPLGFGASEDKGYFLEICEEIKRHSPLYRTTCLHGRPA